MGKGEEDDDFDDDEAELVCVLVDFVVYCRVGLIFLQGRLRKASKYNAHSVAFGM